ncbi:hypothetical protein AB3331_09365 [Streptococcus sp. H49]|uniref:hypothetical protein n=1 Tax=Streptococcus huangxiaojuni TaxID=3237239 RepID=UPI0034A59E06
MNNFKTESYKQLEETIYLNSEFQHLKKHYYQLFKDYACEGNTNNLKKDIDDMFSKTDGIPFIFSHVTFKNTTDTIYTTPKKVEADLYALKQKYFNKFNWHIQHLNPSGIHEKILELYFDLAEIPKKYLK